MIFIAQITDLTHRDLLIIFWVIISVAPIMIWGINRHLKKQDKKEEKLDEFITIANKNLTELTIISKHNDSRITRIEDRVFVVKYPVDK